MAPREVRYVKTVALCHSSCRTNGRTWCTVAGSHKPYGSRRAHPRCSPSPSFAPSPLRLSDVSGLALADPRLRLSRGMHFAWHSAGFCPSPGFTVLSPAHPLSLCRSIVHNYTIRLLNRLMRPLLPAPALSHLRKPRDEAPFTLPILSSSLWKSLSPFLDRRDFLFNALGVFSCSAFPFPDFAGHLVDHCVCRTLLTGQIIPYCNASFLVASSLQRRASTVLGVPRAPQIQSADFISS